ncbi:MAG: hypothetical protein Q9220_002203 [cf. Caloplaca sp. 1 TL-2023]
MKGEYQPAGAIDLRSPCPVVNAFANHGLIPRDGRNVRAEELNSAIDELGLGGILGKVLVWGAFLERSESSASTRWNPLAYMHWHFGTRDVNQKDPIGIPSIDLDQLSRHGAIEHDVSMTRLDFAQGDNHSMQAHLVEQLLRSSSDGSYITTSDFARLRRTRLTQQKVDNPVLKFPSLLHFVTAGQIAATQMVFGDESKGHRIPVCYIEALFKEERLPIKEGWRKKQGWLMGLLGVIVQQLRVRIAIGRTGEEKQATE